MSLQVVYVTVGTTRFNALINELTKDKVLRILKSRGCRQLIIQHGYGAALSPATIQCIFNNYGITVQQYNFKMETVRTDLINADLIIGHGGAGTCMDILNNHKHGLIVVNDKLMNNHQTELAREFSKQGFLYYCDTRNLANSLKDLNFDELRPYDMDSEISANRNKFVRYLNALVTA